MPTNKASRTFAQQIADASLAIARANHYLVGFDPFMAEGMSYDDCHDAYQILVGYEKDRTNKIGPAHVDRAIRVLASYVATVHHVTSM